VLSRTIDVPAAKSSTVLHLVVGHDPQGDFDLVVKVDGKEAKRTAVSKDTTTNHWLTLDVDLSSYAGKTVKVELLNQASGWSYEAAYWAEATLISR
jgi:hypothetical protein